MKGFTVRLIVASIFLLFATFCYAEEKKADDTLTITKESDGKTVTLAKDKAAIIALKGNPTTGYLWSVASVEGKAVAQDGDVQYVADKVKPGIVGSGGRFEARFVAKEAGKATIIMHYKRPFEKDKPPVETFTVTIEVK